MEAGYVNHQVASLFPISTSEVFDHGKTLSVSMTATMDSMGNLVLGIIYTEIYSTVLMSHVLYSDMNHCMSIFYDICIYLIYSPWWYTIVVIHLCILLFNGLPLTHTGILIYPYFSGLVFLCGPSTCLFLLSDNLVNQYMHSLDLGVNLFLVFLCMSYWSSVPISLLKLYGCLHVSHSSFTDFVYFSQFVWTSISHCQNGSFQGAAVSSLDSALKWKNPLLIQYGIEPQNSFPN